MDANMTQETTRIVRRSSLKIPKITEVIEAAPELEPLIPAESALNLSAYSRFLEALLSAALVTE